MEKFFRLFRKSIFHSPGRTEGARGAAERGTAVLHGAMTSPLSLSTTLDRGYFRRTETPIWGPPEVEHQMNTLPPSSTRPEKLLPAVMPKVPSAATV